MVSFTYVELPPNMSLVSEHFNYFWEKWKRATGLKIPSYVLVPEFGKETRRLHIHMGVNWWRELNAVEVCETCAVDGLRKKRRDIPSADSFCIGCLWGRGFVGRPSSNSDGSGMSRYLSKYLSKDLAQGTARTDVLSQSECAPTALPFGGHRYRASIGAKPVPIKLFAPSFDVAWDAAREVAGSGAPPVFEWNANAEERAIFGDATWMDFLSEWRCKNNVQDL
jgi:hypothetical protein